MIPHGKGDQCGVEDEGRQFAAGNRARQDVVAADPQNDPDGGEDQKDHGCGQQAAQPRTADRGVKGVVHILRKPGAVAVLMGEGLNRADRVQAFFRIGADIGDPVLAVAGQFPDPPPDQQDRRDDDRDDQQDQRGQFRIGHRHHHNAADHDQQVAQGHGGAGPDDGLQKGRVGGQAGQDFAGLGDLEEAGVEPQDPVEDRVAQIGHHPFAKPGDQIESAIGPDGHQDGQADQEGQRIVQRRRVAVGESAVDQTAQPLTQRKDGARRDRQGNCRQHDAGPVGGQKGQGAAQRFDIAPLGPVGSAVSRQWFSPDLVFDRVQ